MWCLCLWEEYDVDPKKRVAAYVLVKGRTAASMCVEELGAIAALAKVRTRDVCICSGILHSIMSRCSHPLLCKCHENNWMMPIQM
jgi:hypothetical protein